MERLTSALGLMAMMALAWLLSSHPRRMQWRPVLGGLVLQFLVGLFTLRTAPGRALFSALGNAVTGLLGFVDEGALFVFGVSEDSGHPRLLLTSFAFSVLPTIIFFSSLMAILYHFRIMQRVVQAAAFVMRRAMHLSGAESLSVAANIFLGQVEAPARGRQQIEVGAAREERGHDLAAAV